MKKTFSWCTKDLNICIDKCRHKKRDFLEWDRNVFLCVLRNGIRCSVSQLWIFGSVRMELFEQWEEGKQWIISVNVWNTNQFTHMHINTKTLSEMNSWFRETSSSWSSNHITDLYEALEWCESFHNYHCSFKCKIITSGDMKIFCLH